MQDRNFTNKSKPKLDKDSDKEQILNNNNKLNHNFNNNLITKKISENEKNNKNIKKNAELDNKNNIIVNKNTNTKNSPKENLGLLRENNQNLNNKKSTITVNNLEIDHQRKSNNIESDHAKKRVYKEEEIHYQEEHLIKENINISHEDKHNHVQKTETSLYSYVNRSTQLDYFHDLLNFIKSEKSKSNKISSNNKVKNSSSNLNDERKTMNKNQTPVIERFRFNFDITIRLTLNKFYNLYPTEFNKITVENLIFNKNCHLVSVFKDHMIFDYVDEFLKRFYFHEESKERIPKISNYYKNYLKFFCNPVFRDFEVNNIIQGYGDYKAEMYYNRNYGNKANNNNNGIENNNYNPPRKKQHQENSQLKKIFDTNAKISIERNLIMSCSNMSIKQQIFNESNFQYYIDKIQISKMKAGKEFNHMMLLEDELNLIDKRQGNFNNKNDFSNVNNSKYTNTLLEFSQHNLNNYCFTNNTNDDSRRLDNADNSNLVIDNFKDDISNIMQYKDLQRILKEQGKNFEKENRLIVNKNLHSRLNGITNSEKDIIKSNKDVNDNIIKNNLEKIVKNNASNKRNYNSNLNEFESRTMLKKNKRDYSKDENLYTNRSNEESILSLINIIDLRDAENLAKLKSNNREKDADRSKDRRKDSKLTIRYSNKSETDKINTDNKTKLTKVNTQASHNDFLNNKEKNTVMQLEPNSNNNYKILSKGLNNDNPYIIKKPDFKENRISISNNSVLNKLNFKNIDSNSNSKSKSNSKTFTDPNNNSNNAYLGLNTSKTLTNLNKSNFTNSSAINIKSAANPTDKSNLKPSEIQVKSIFKPKINSVELIKSNLSKNNSSNFNNEKTENNKHDSDNAYFPSGAENHKKAGSKFTEKSNAQLIDRAVTINLLNRNKSKIDETKQLISAKNYEQFAYKTQDKKQAIEKTIRADNNNFDHNKGTVSNSNSKDKTFEKKLFSTLDPSNLLLNSQSKFNLFSPTDSKNNEINRKLNTKNIIISNNKNNLRISDNEPKNIGTPFNQANNKLSPSNKNGISAFKANNNIINYNLYNKSLNSNNFEGKKINVAMNRNSDDTTNTHTKSAEIRVNNNLKNPSTITSDIEIINLNQAQEQNKNKITSVNPPHITLNYKINSRNHNQNSHLIKITNSNSNNLATGNENTNSNVNFNKSENNNNKYVISNLKHNTQNLKYNTSKNPITLANAVKEGIATNNFMINSSVYNNNLNMTDKIKKAINTYSKNTPGNNDKNIVLSEAKHHQITNNVKDIKKPIDLKQKLIKKTSINASNKGLYSLNQNNLNNNKFYNNHQEHQNMENFRSENSNSHNIEVISDETLENLSPNAINEINNNILINNPNLMNKPNALTDIMKITLSFYMDKSNSRNNRPSSTTSGHNSANNIVNNQLGSMNVLNDNLKKTTIINKIENLNKFNININNQFNLGNLNSINANQLQQINNIANLNPGIFINNSSNSNTNMNNNLNNNGILEYNSKKKSQSKTITNKAIENNINNQFNHNSNNLSNNISATTHNGKLLKFNEKTQISEITNYGFPITENKNIKNNSDNYNYKNQESSCLSTNNKFNKSSNLENAYFNFDKKAQISIDKSNNFLSNNNPISKKNDPNANFNSNNNNNAVNSNLKLTFSQDINSLKNIIEKNKILSRNKNANLFKISSNQNMTKPGFISEEDISNNKDLNAKTNYMNNNNYPNTLLNLNSTNKNSSVFYNASKNKNSFSEKSDMNLLKDNNIQIKAFNSYAHKEKEISTTINQKKGPNKSPNSNTTEGNQLVYLKKTIDEKNLKLAITKLKLPSPSAKVAHATNDADSGNKPKINLNSNKKQSTDSFIQKDFNSTKENVSGKINFNTNLKNLKISFENKNISAGDSNNNNNNNANKINNLNNLNANLINLNKNPSYNTLIKSKDSQIDQRANIISNKNAKKIVFIKK